MVFESQCSTFRLRWQVLKLAQDGAAVADIIGRCSRSKRLASELIFVPLSLISREKIIYSLRSSNTGVLVSADCI